MKQTTQIRQLVLYAMLGTLLFAVKLAMAHIPNIEPASLLVMLFAVCLGWRGLYPVYLYVFLEFAVWGVHLWSLCYLYVWLLLFAAAYFLPKMTSPLGWAILSGSFGLLFGALCIPVYWLAGGWASAAAWWVSGIPWDLTHCAGNFALTLVLFNPLRAVFSRLQTQFQV